MQRLVTHADADAGSASKGRSEAGPDERKALVRGIYVAREATEHIATLIDKVRRGRKLSPEPLCVLIVGDTGAGKSAFLQQYVKRSPPWRDPSGNLVQSLLLVELDSFVTVIGAAKLILRALQDPSDGAGKLGDLTHRIRILTKAQRVEVVLIDEFQHIVDTGSRTVNKVADWIKQLAKSANLSFVMAGMPEAARIIDANSQFAGITPYRHTLGMLAFEKDGERRIFRAFLAEVDAKLPFDRLARLADIEIAKVLFDATKGSLRTLMHLIREAAGHAIDRDVAAIGMADLEYGFEQIEAMSPLKVNPFAAMGVLLPDHPGFGDAA